MKRIAFLITPLAVMTLLACNNGRAYNPDTQINVPPANNQPVNAVATMDTGKNPQGVNVQPMTVQPNLPAKTGGALNPAHGQPGHRCDIAVGAPLSSPAAAAPAAAPTTVAPSTATTVPKPVTINPQPAAQKVAPGMNPAHGQPGHRCDIAVGAPLNSPAAATTTPQQVSPLLPQVTPIAPVKKDTLKN